MEDAATRGSRNPVARAFRILAWMAARDDGPWGLRELAKGLDMNPSTVHRVLGLLEDEGLVLQDGPGGGYRVGPAMLRLAWAAAGTNNLRDAALPHLQHLAQRSGETATLGLYDPTRRQTSIVAVVESDAPVRFAATVNEWRDLHTGASGRAVMAFLPADERAAVIASTHLAPATEHTITDPKKLEGVLERVRAQGYAFSLEERRLGGVGIAAPVFAPGGTVLGEVGVGVPTQRFVAKDEPRLAALVVSCGQAITSALGGERPATG